MRSWKQLSSKTRISFSAVIFLIFAFIAFAVILFTLRRRNLVCDTKLCQEIAEELYSNLNTSANPCHDFYQFTCGKWISRYQDGDNITLKRKFETPHEMLNKRIEEILSSTIEGNYPKIVHDAQNFYRECKKVNLEDEHVSRQVYDTVKEKLDFLGGWPLITPNWNEDSFDVEKSLIHVHKDIWLDPIFDWEFAPSNFTGKGFIEVSPENVFEDFGRVMFATDTVALILQDLLINKTVIENVKELASKLLTGDELEILEPVINLEIESLTAFVKELSAMSNLIDLEEDLEEGEEMPLKEVQSRFDTLNWLNVIKSAFGEVGISETENVAIRDVEFFHNASMLMKNTDKRTIANYIGWRFLVKYTTRIEDCLESTKAGFSHALGRVYVDRYLNDEILADLNKLVTELRKAFQELLDENKWMDKVTRDLAKKKLAVLKENLALPNFYKDNVKLQEFYSGLELTSGSGVGVMIKNIDEILKWESKQIKTNWIDKQLDYVWKDGTIASNAVYHPSTNNMAVFAGILLEPFYRLERPAALNYGALGYVIGHEFTHAFDNTGRYFNEYGDFDSWWTNDSVREYKKREDCFLRQFSRLAEDSDEITEYAKYTNGENIADGGGIREAFRAFKILQEMDSKMANTRLPGAMKSYSPQQLFFISFGNSFCASMDEITKILLKYTDEHSLDENRVLGTLMSSDDFSQAFDCPVGSRMNMPHKCVLMYKK